MKQIKMKKMPIFCRFFFINLLHVSEDTNLDTVGSCTSRQRAARNGVALAALVFGRLPVCNLRVHCAVV